MDFQTMYLADRNFYTIVPKETLISIKLRLQWYIGWHDLKEKVS